MNHQYKTVLITGGAKRIGAAIARRFHQAQYHIFLHYRNSETQALALAQELNSVRALSVDCLQADLSDLDAITQLQLQVQSHTKHLNVLVNNASEFYKTPWGKINQQDWGRLIDSNVRHSLFLTQALSQVIKESAGSVINISDHLPYSNLLHYPVYSVAKGALNTLTASMALCLAPQARVNAIALGVILPQKQESMAGFQLKDQVPLQSRGTIENVADTVYFLGSEDASYITGQIIPVDGGRRLQHGSI